MNFDNEKFVEAFGTYDQKKELAERKERIDNWLSNLGITVLTDEDINNYLIQQINGTFK